MADRQLRTRIIRALGGAVVAGALVGGGTALAADQGVAISGFSFSPASVTVNVGDSVTWTNSDAQAHTATADDASWDTGTIAGSGATGAVTFTVAGAFPYHCSIHPTMLGTVTVQAAAATAAPPAGSTTPPTDTSSTAATDRGSAGDSLAALLIAGLALTTAAAVIRRKPASKR